MLNVIALSSSWETAFKVGKANWGLKTHRLEGSGSSHHSGLHFCPRFQDKHSSVPLIGIMVGNYSSSSNWNWLIFPTPAAYHVNYPFSPPANPLMLLQHLSVWHRVPAFLVFPFLAMYPWLLLAGGLICHSNNLNISSLKVYSLSCTDTFQTRTRLLHSFLCEIKRCFLFGSTWQSVTTLLSDVWDRVHSLDFVKCSLHLSHYKPGCATCISMSLQTSCLGITNSVQSLLLKIGP